MYALRVVLWTVAALLLFVALALVVLYDNEAADPFMFLDPAEPLVDKGVAMVMVCGEQPTRETVNMTAAEVVRPRWTGERWTYRHGPAKLGQGSSACVVYYHHPRNGAS